MKGVDHGWFLRRIKLKGLSQRRIGAELGLKGGSAVNHIVSGRRKISAWEAKELARLLEVSLEELHERAGITKEALEAMAEEGSESPRLPRLTSVEISIKLSNCGTCTMKIPKKLTKEAAEMLIAFVNSSVSGLICGD